MLKYIKEAGELYRLSFGAENRKRMDRSVAWLFTVFIVVFLPHSFLAKFSNQFVIDLLGQRTRNDYLYLLANNPGFADAYIGGMTLQLLTLAIAVLLPLYYTLSSKNIVFIKEKTNYYLLAILFVAIFSIGSTYVLFGITDYGFHEVGISWFEDNQLKHNKWLPAPENSSIFVATGLAFSVLTFVPLILGQFLKVLNFGKRVAHQDLMERDDDQQDRPSS